MGRDFNDMMLDAGAEAVAAAIDAAQAPEPKKPERQQRRKKSSRYNTPNPPDSPVTGVNPPENDSNPPESDSNPPAKPRPAKPRVLGQYRTAVQVRPRLDGRFAYDATADDWLRWTGTHWARATPGDIARAVVPVLAKQRGDFSHALLASVIRFLSYDLPAPADEPARHMLPCLNGVLDLNTGALTAHAPAQWMRWCLPYGFDAQAQCPLFLAWLDDVTEGRRDVQLILRAWQRAVVTGRADLQRYLELIGPAGSGKSTFLWLCEQLVGSENTVVTDLQALAGRFETANLYRKRLCIITDAGRFGGDVDVLKAITGQDAIRYEVKGKQAGNSFVFGGMVALAANEPVASNDLSSGLARRRVTVHFDRIIPPNRRDEGLKDRLRAELPGVLAWTLAMPEAEAVRAIKAPGRVTRLATLDTLIATNPVAGWLNECCVHDPAGLLPIGTVRRDGPRVIDTDTLAYPNHVAWCEEHGHRPASTVRFSGLVADLARSHIDPAVERGTDTGNRSVVRGLRLRTAHDTGPGCLYSALGGSAPDDPTPAKPADSGGLRPESRRVEGDFRRVDEPKSLIPDSPEGSEGSEATSFAHARVKVTL